MTPDIRQVFQTELAAIAARRVFCLRRGKVPFGSNGRPLTRSFDSAELQGRLLPLDDALDRAGQHGLDGIGIAFFPGCGVVGLDLDHCLTDGRAAMTEHQKDALRPFLGTYLERSMSGTGLHAIALGNARTVKLNGAIELFGDSNFIALTGDSVKK